MRVLLSSILHAALALGASALMVPITTDPKAATAGYQNEVYFVNWWDDPCFIRSPVYWYHGNPMSLTYYMHIRGIYGRNYQPAQLPASELSIVLYAFANLQSNGLVFVLPSFWAPIYRHPPYSYVETNNGTC